MKSYLSDPQSFPHKCPKMFEKSVGDTIYSMYNDNTEDFLNSFINQMSVNTDPETVEQLTYDIYGGTKRDEF